jgi:hypothetical protein
MTIPPRRTPKKIKLDFHPHEAIMLHEAGYDGGFQGTMTLVSGRLYGTQILELTDEEFGRLFRTATQYGAGGYQSKIREAIARPILRALFGSQPRKKANETSQKANV